MFTRLSFSLKEGVHSRKKKSTSVQTPGNVYQTYHSAWRDTIHAGMARQNHYLSFYESCGEKAQILLEFSLNWCKNNVFCSGDLFSPK
jgi:hypothetical protein